MLYFLVNLNSYKIIEFSPNNEVISKDEEVQVVAEKEDLPHTFIYNGTLFVSTPSMHGNFVILNSFNY